MPATNSNVQVVCFKRDLRIDDHRALVHAAARGPVLPLYVVEPEWWSQTDMSARQWAFVRECLDELREALARLGQPLVVRIGPITDVLAPLPSVAVGEIPDLPDPTMAADPCPGRQPGGRDAALERRQSFLQERGRDYRSAMSSPITGETACSRLSPHLAWGSLSVREAAQATCTGTATSCKSWRTSGDSSSTTCTARMKAVVRRSRIRFVSRPGSAAKPVCLSSMPACAA
jgi:deoxyribodipyrimidine photolyase